MTETSVNDKPSVLTRTTKTINVLILQQNYNAD